DEVLIGRKATGTLLHDNLVPGRNLYFLSTGTGLAPFMSLIRDPATYERFEKVVLVHGVRLVSELAYETFISKDLPADELIGEMVASQLIYYPTVTREEYPNRGRVTELFASDDWFASLGLPTVDAEHDRVMLCGSPGMLADMKVMLEGKGFLEGSSSTPASYVVERAFVEK
ncbi:MAG TPA: ferredoxin--NADP reductase, partial [Bosea sp. (in: a-proteobacteria)]